MQRYCDEFIDILEKFGVKVKMFADDAKMCVIDDTDVARLQQAVDALINWANIWQLSVSVKCCILHIGKVICDTSIDINGVVLPVVHNTRDLGVVMTSDLSPSLHVSEIVAKGHKRAAVIHRAFVSRDLNVLLQAGWIKMALGMEVGLVPCYIVLDGDPAPRPERGTATPLFAVRLFWPPSPISATAELVVRFNRD